jgi:hypothetical protein
MAKRQTNVCCRWLVHSRMSTMTADPVAGLAWTAMVAHGTKQTSKLCRVCSLPLLSRISSVNTSGTRTEHRHQFNFTFKIRIIGKWPSLIKIKDNFAIFIFACKARWKDLSLEELRLWIASSTEKV